MFTRCAGLELDESNRGVRIISVAPGIVDTGMQEKLRSVAEESFPMKKKFLHYKNAGHLLDAAQVAARLINIISSSSLENGAVVDLRTL